MMKAIVIALDGSPGEIQQAMPHIRQLLEGHQPTGQAVFEAPTTVTDGGPGVTDAGPGVIDGGPTPGYPRLSDYVAAGGLISDRGQSLRLRQTGTALGSDLEDPSTCTDLYGAAWQDAWPAPP